MTTNPSRIPRIRADHTKRVRRIRPKSAPSAPAPRGQLLVIAVFLLALVLALSVASVSLTTVSGKATTAVSRQRSANEAAAAGIDKAIFCLNQTSGVNCGGTFGSSYTGETVSLSPSSTFTTTVTTIDALTREVQSTGYFPNAADPQSSQVIRARVGINSDDISFNYALQAGNGGLQMNNNSSVTGNVYSNLDVAGGSGTSISGDVWIAGGTQLVADQQSTATTTNQSVGQASANADVAQSFIPSQSEVLNKVSFYIKKVGSPGNKTVRLLSDNSGVPSKTELANGTLQSSLVTSNYGWIDVSMGTPPNLIAGTRYWVVIDSSANASNYYHWGLDQNNGYANGKGMISANWSASSPVWNDAGGDLAFKAWLGGVVTRLSGIDIGGDAHANTIQNCDIFGDAYYQTISGSSVGGASYPGSVDPPTHDFPISDAQIAEWKTEAAAGGVVAGNYVLDEDAASLGPKEITGNLVINNNAVFTVTGTLYVHGTITISNNATVRLASGYGSSSGVVVSDGTVLLSNNTIFQGAGPGSFLMFLTASSADPAINISNNAEGAIFYAANGTVEVENVVMVTSITAKKIHLQNNAELIYDTGLADAVFTSGPGGSWVLQKDTWREIK